jgi:hypothetical protein
MKYAGSVKLRQTFNIGEVVNDYGCEQKFARHQSFATRERHLKLLIYPVRVDHLRLAQLDSFIRTQFFASESQEFPRLDTVTRYESVNRM